MAAFTSTPATWTNNSDANFRAWGTNLAARFLAAGWVQTADTGQINWVTVTAPAGVSTFQGYEIWRFADALQASAPIYLKIEYGEGNGTDGPAIRFSVGTGSNGSGTLTGNVSSTIIAACTSTPGGGTYFGSGDTGRFSFALDVSAGMYFSVERTKDATGADTTEGLLIFTKTIVAAAGSGSTLVWIAGVGSPAGNPTSSLGALFPGHTSFTYGAQVGVAPIFGEKPLFTNPGLGSLGYYTGDITAQTVSSIYMYGTLHNYYMCSSGLINSTAFRGAGGGTEAIAVRYE